MGSDLCDAFGPAYKAAQGKKCRSDIDADVAETPENVAETPASVAATKPLKPLKGGTVKDPPKEQLPLIPSLREGNVAAEIDTALAQVAKALSITRRRTLREIRKQITLEFEKGAGADVAARMIRAWEQQAARSEVLRVKYGPEKFFGLGIWANQGRWHFNEEKLALMSGASIGGYQQ